MAQNGQQLVNVLETPYGSEPYGSPFPAITSDSPSPSWPLLTAMVRGIQAVNQAGGIGMQYPNNPTANCLIQVAYNIGNQNQLGGILVSQSLTTVFNGL